VDHRNVCCLIIVPAPVQALLTPVTVVVAVRQADAAKLSPPHLRTIVVNMGGTSNSWFSTVRNHGAFELKQIVWRLRKPPRGTDDSVVREHFAHETVLSWLLALPIRPGLSPLALCSNNSWASKRRTHRPVDRIGDRCRPQNAPPQVAPGISVRARLS